MEKQRVSLVTGASSGIGAATAVRLAERGDTVLVHFNSDVDAAERVLSECEAVSDRPHATVRADVTTAQGVTALFAVVEDRFGRLDVLVNNAGGLLQRSTVEDAERDTVDRIVMLNLSSAILVAGAAVRYMQPGGGSIVNVTSIASYNGGGGGSGVYAAAKGGIVSLTRAHAKELASSGIRVNAISPGVIATPFHDRYTKPEMLEAMLATIPLQRLGEARECADLIEFLSGPASAYITGQVIHINGGQYFS